MSPDQFQVQQHVGHPIQGLGNVAVPDQMREFLKVSGIKAVQIVIAGDLHNKCDPAQIQF
jgi:hypothetical protein